MMVNTGCVGSVWIRSQDLGGVQHEYQPTTIKHSVGRFFLFWGGACVCARVSALFEIHGSVKAPGFN